MTGTTTFVKVVLKKFSKREYVLSLLLATCLTPLAYLGSAVFHSAEKVPVNFSLLTATLDAWDQSEDFSAGFFLTFSKKLELKKTQQPKKLNDFSGQNSSNRLK